MTVALIVVAAIVLIVGLFVLLTYNRLVRLRLACDNSWAQIEVALKLRHDLVPNLVAAVAGYAGHERTTFERTAESRSAAISAVGAGSRRVSPARLRPNPLAPAPAVSRVAVVAVSRVAAVVAPGNRLVAPRRVSGGTLITTITRY